MVCSFLPAKNHVSLIFFRGAELKSGKVIFEGTGKKLRHIKYRIPAEVKIGVVKKLVKEAIALNKAEK